MATFKNVMMRIFAVIAAEALGVIGAGSLVGIEVWQAAVLAGALGANRKSPQLGNFFLFTIKRKMDLIVGAVVAGAITGRKFVAELTGLQFQMKI